MISLPGLSVTRLGENWDEGIAFLLNGIIPDFFNPAVMFSATILVTKGTLERPAMCFTPMRWPGLACNHSLWLCLNACLNGKNTENKETRGCSLWEQCRVKLHGKSRWLEWLSISSNTGPSFVAFTWYWIWIKLFRNFPQSSNQIRFLRDKYWWNRRITSTNKG